MEQDKNNFRLFNTESGVTVARYTLGKCIVYEIHRPTRPQPSPFIDQFQPEAKILNFPQSADIPDDAA